MFKNIAADPQNRVRIQKQLKLFRRALLVVFLFIIAMLTLVTVGRMNDEVRGTGTVSGIREYKLKTLVNARTVEICHQEGDFVKQGEPLIIFDKRRQEDVVTALENRIKELRLSLRAKESEIALLKIDPLPAAYRYAESDLAEALAHFHYSEEEKAVYDKLSTGNKSKLSELQFLYKYASSKTALERRKADAEKVRDGSMRREILARGEAELQLLRQQIVSAEAKLEMEKRILEDYVLRAPDDGILTEIPPRPGTYHDKGEVVVRFAANQHKRVIANVSEKQIYKVQKGQLVRIASSQYNYLDYGYFLGVVDEVYQLPVDEKGQRFYQVKIVLKKEPYPLRFGSSCDVAIITGRERILFALLDLKSQDYARRRVKARSVHNFEKAFLKAEEALQQEEARRKESAPAPRKK